MKYLISISCSVLVALLLFSCGVTQESLENDFQLPSKFEQNEQSTSPFEEAKDSVLLIQDRKDFFKDSTLSALIEEAIVNNFDMNLVYQKLMQSKAEVRSTQGIRLPELGINLNVGQRKFGDYTIDGVGNYDTQFSPNLNSDQRIPYHIPDFYTGFSTSWEIYLWGKLKSKKRAAFSRFLAQEQGVKLLTTQLVSEIAESYYKLVILDKEQDIIEENIQLQENALMVVSAQKETGKANELAIELMSAQLLNAKVLLFEIKQNILKCENKLNFLIGRFPQKIQINSMNFDQSLSAISQIGIPSNLLENRPDIIQAKHEIIAQNADVHAAKVAFYPSLNINANIGYQAFKAALFLDPRSFAYSFLGGIASPLLNRRKLKAELMLSKANQKSAYINYEKTVVKAFTEVYEAVNLIENIEEMKKLKEEEVNILKTSVSTSRALFTSGRANYLEVITSQKNFLQAQIELLDIYYNNMMNQIYLYKSIGGGWK